MHQVHELVNQYITQFSWKTFSWHLILAYGISWLYFFFSVYFFVIIFGKVTGTLLNYGISWILMVGVVYILQKLNNVRQ